MKKGFYWKNPYLLILPKNKKKKKRKILLQAVVKWMIRQQRGDFVNSNIYISLNENDNFKIL